MQLNGPITQSGTGNTWSRSLATPCNRCGEKQRPTLAKKQHVWLKSLKKHYVATSGSFTPFPVPVHPTTFSLQNLGRPNRGNTPPQNATLMQRAVEEWERTVCENKAVAILDKLQEGRPALIQQNGGTMLIAIVLHRPLPEAQALVDNPHEFLPSPSRSADASDPRAHAANHTRWHRQRSLR